MTELAVSETTAPPVTAPHEGGAQHCSVAASKTRTLALVLAVVLFNAFGNLLLALGMRQVPETSILRPVGVLEAMLNPFVVSGITLLILWLLSRMALLSWADLSFVLPLTSLGYVFAAVFGKVFLHESVSVGHWAGTLLIFAGTTMVGTTEQQTQEEPPASGGEG